MRSWLHRTIRAGLVAGAAVGVAVGCLVVLAPMGPLATAKMLIIKAGSLGVQLYDPHQPPAQSSVCNCSGDWAYMCDSPELDYYDRVRWDSRLRHFYAAPRSDFDTYLAYANFLRDRFPHGFHSREDSHPGEVHIWNLLEMLDEADAGESFLCGEISLMLSQMIIAGGGFARTVGLRRAAGTSSSRRGFRSSRSG